MQMMLDQMAQETEACCAANAPTQTGRAAHTHGNATHGNEASQLTERLESCSKHMRPGVIRNQRDKAVILNGHKLCIRTLASAWMWAVRPNHASCDAVSTTREW